VLVVSVAACMIQVLQLRLSCKLPQAATHLPVCWLQHATLLTTVPNTKA
jgi:hypothetical protein